jgi:hypothetical protein
MSNYDTRRSKHTAILAGPTNPRGEMISTSDIGVRSKPQHTVVTGGFWKPGLAGMDLRSKFGDLPTFQVHSHDSGVTWHQVPTKVRRTYGDQVPLSPRSNQSMHDKFFRKY